MSEAYERIAGEIQTLGDQYDSKVAELAMAQDVLAELTDRIDILEGEAEALNIMHTADLQRVADQQTQISLLRTKELAYLDAIADLEAEVKRLTDIIDPPPATKRVLESYLVQGGGGFDWIEAMANGALICGTDVGAHVYFGPDSWEGLKWNAGTSMRHCASGTIDTNGEVISAGGSPSGGEGVYVLDTIADDWNGPISGSTALKFNSQNSYGEPGSTKPGAWPFGYGGNFEQRSVGRLCWRRASGDLVAAQFGYASAGGGGVAVLHNGAKRVIAGTENWACRGMQRLSDATYLVSVEKARSTNTSLPTPGGLWVVNVDGNVVTRPDQYPDTPEHIDYNGTDVVVAMRNAGIWRNGQDITFNLPKASEWYSVAIRPDGAIVAGCMDPSQAGTARFWSVAVLAPGASTWVNYTPTPRKDKDDVRPTLNSQEPFIAVNWQNTLGNAGATVMDVAWRGDVPVCSASGIVWGAPNGVMEPAPGSWIIVNKAYDRTPDGYEAVAESDFRCHWRKPGARWDKIGFGGGNEGGDVSWIGHVLHYKGVDGTRQTFNADTGAIGTTTAAMPPKNLEAPMTAAKRAEILQTMEVQQFGSRTGTFALDADTLILWGHGGAISRMVEA